MARLLIAFVVVMVLWQLYRVASKEMARKATLEEARSAGLQEAQRYIQSPILLEDYADARGIPKETLESMVEQEKIPFYIWRQFTFIENRELIDVNK